METVYVTDGSYKTGLQYGKEGFSETFTRKGEKEEKSKRHRPYHVCDRIKDEIKEIDRSDWCKY